MSAPSSSAGIISVSTIHPTTKTNSQKDEEERNPLVVSSPLNIGNDSGSVGIMSSDRDEQKKGLSILPRNYNTRRRLILTVICFAAFLFCTQIFSGNGGASTFLSGVTPDRLVEKSAREGLAMMKAAGRRLAISSWNIAAINNNPFEYFCSGLDSEYDSLMVNVEQFIVSPGDKDVPVNQVFTEDMFTRLDTRMTGVGWKSVRSYWESDFRDRKIVTGFMKDPILGSKRLASMPDRITNTINVDGGGQVFRPTVINMYDGDLSTLEKWWKAWEAFMFDDTLRIKGKTSVEEKIPYQLLQKIKKSKYPDITTEEEKDSLPLQTMCGAIFDSILVHMMNEVSSSPQAWQTLKSTIVENLNKQKVPHTLDILDRNYADSDIITLQEVSSSFIDEARASALGPKFHIVAPSNLDSVRDQNSVIFLNRNTFPKGSNSEISQLVENSFPPDEDVPVAKGDILAITAETKQGVPLVIASFHGDTNGLATKPVLTATLKAMSSDSKLAGHRLIFGMDANTYEHAKPGKQQDVLDFAKHFVSNGLTSAWGDTPNPKNYTTYNARTYLQPQLNKACKSDEKRSKGDVNPKDFILFPKRDFKVISTWKDNTGDKKYIEDMPFPTLKFPSDHGILHTVIEPTAQASKS